MTELLQNRYRIDQPLGMGGMGMVYRGYDQLLSRTVAIKLLSKASLGTEGRTRLLSEARAAAQLNHPNIMVVHDAGETEDGPYIVMELLTGETLRQHKPADLAEVGRIFRQMCAALAHAHAAGIIHRDLKPENVMCLPSGEVKLMDFGLARSQGDASQTEEGVLTGTLLYMAPELLMGQPASVQSDLYALGVMVYELACGHPPFQGENLSALIYHALQGEPRPPKEVNPDVPEWLNSLILRLLAKQPEERPESAAALLELIEMPERGSSAAQPPPAKRHNLPEQLTTFIGREGQIENVCDLVRDNRLVTLTGAGGVGKTRLGLKVAENFCQAGSQRVFWVELAPLVNENMLIPAVAAALGVRGSQDEDLLEKIQSRLSAENTLLVLDNAEHLVAACGDLVQTLLLGCPNLRILITSRILLGSMEETTFRVPSLSLPGIGQRLSSEQAMEFEALRLFVARASMKLTKFELSKENVGAVQDICSHLDGIPLAIELVAARVRMMSVQEISARLGDIFNFSADGRAGHLSRHRTLRAAIEWSFRLLGEQSSLLFRRLCVFSGCFNLEAVEEVCVGDGLEKNQVLGLIGELVDQSILSPDFSVHGVSYYRMLETVRQFAHEILAHDGTQVRLYGRHLAYFTRYADRADTLRVTAQEVDFTDQLYANLGNLRAALDWALTEPGDGHIEQGLRISSDLFWFWFSRGLGGEALAWWDRLLAVEQATRDGGEPQGERALQRARVLRLIPTMSIYYLKNISDERMDAATEESLALLAGLPEAQARHERGLTLMFSLGTRERSWFEVVNEAAAIFRAEHDEVNLITALINCGIAVFMRADCAAPRPFYDEARILSMRLGDFNGLSQVYGALGELNVLAGDYAQGEREMAESLRYALLDKDQWQEFNFYTRSMMALTAQGKYAQGLLMGEKGLALVREFQDRFHIAWNTCHSARCAWSQADYELALRLCQAAAESSSASIGDPTFVVDPLLIRGRVLLSQGWLELARHEMHAALLHVGTNCSKMGFDTMLDAVAVLLASLGKAEAAVVLFGKVESSYRKLYHYLSPRERQEHAAAMERARLALPEENFEQAWLRGGRMDRAESLKFSLESL